jgi:hypothetical protein
MLAGAALSTAAAAVPQSVQRIRALLATASSGHPDPRPGIDASRVLTSDRLSVPHLAALFDAVREIPHIVDGIRCFCGCADLDGYRSLLSCYEDPGMAQYCDICEGQARLAYQRVKEGQSLDQIRRATDARYGHGGHVNSHREDA